MFQDQINTAQILIFKNFRCLISATIIKTSLRADTERDPPLDKVVTTIKTITLRLLSSARTTLLVDMTATIGIEVSRSATIRVHAKTLPTSESKSISTDLADRETLGETSSSRWDSDITTTLVIPTQAATIPVTVGPTTNRTTGKTEVLLRIITTTIGEVVTNTAMEEAKIGMRIDETIGEMSSDETSSDEIISEGQAKKTKTNISSAVNLPH